MTDTSLAPERYLALIEADTSRLLVLAEQGLVAPVPSCPDWSVADLVTHVAMVYEHKVRVMADGAFPAGWPPPELEGREPVEFLRSASDNLFAEFARHDVDEQTTTFGADTTIGFWVRRMALEIAIHRLDGELAFDDPTDIDAALAVDGVDEMLRVMLGGDWWGGDDFHTQHPVDALVAVETGGVRWVCDVRETSVSITNDADTPAAATVSGPPDSVFGWLWGRYADERVQLAGDPVVVAQFRARLVEVSD